MLFAVKCLFKNTCIFYFQDLFDLSNKRTSEFDILLGEKDIIKKRAKASTFFSLRICLYYIDMHMMHEREKGNP